MARSRSVLILVENLPVPFDRRVWQEATALKQAGYGVSVICPTGKGHNRKFETLDGIHIYRHPFPFEASGALGYLFEYSWALLWQSLLSLVVLFRHGFDVIHACNPPDLCFLVALPYKFLLRKKFIFDHHDLVPELFEAKYDKAGFLHAVLSRLEKATFWLADGSIATNDTFKRIAIERGGMAPERVWVVKSYPDLSRFRRTERDDSLARGRAFTVGYVGIMAGQDGVDQLLDAMHHIIHGRGRTDIQALIIGDGPEHENLQEQARRLEIEDWVTFTGYLKGEDLLRHYSSIDVGVIPDPPNSFNDKVSMNKVFEYMALGIPFVQYDLSEARHDAGDAAVITREATPRSLGEGVLELLADDERRQRMGAFGVERAQARFQWSQEIVTLLEAYATVLA